MIDTAFCTAVLAVKLLECKVVAVVLQMYCTGKARLLTQ